MQTLSSPIKLLTTAAVAGVLASGGIATAAEAPVVSKQHWIAGYALVDFPGTGFQQGEWLGSKAKMVYRDVTIERGQKVRLTLRAHKGQKIRGLGGHVGDLRVKALDRDYAGKRSVRVRVAAGRHAGDGAITERIFALSR